MKNLIVSFRITIFFSLLLGLIYPLAVTGIAQTLFSDKASGQLVTKEGHIVGSLLIAQKFERPEYFWPRPSAVDYNPLPSGGSNLGPTSAALKEVIAARKSQWQTKSPEGAGTPIPAELTFASGSGLDPHISPQGAQAQVVRVAKARGLTETQVQELVKAHTQGRDGGLLGEATVNVLALNLALDKFAVTH